MREWDWRKFKGSEQCLKWARRDLETLAQALQFVPQRRACVQAGGNLGIFPKYLSAVFKLVYAFEPDPTLFEIMKKNAPEPNILRMHAALGADNNPVRMECSRRDNSGRAIHEGLTHVAGPGDIPSIRLDEFNLAVCDLIYLDVEGWELFALRGAAETIKRCRPVIGVEINRNIEHVGHTARELREFITSFGYKRRMTMHSDEVYCPS